MFGIPAIGGIGISQIVMLALAVLALTILMRSTWRRTRQSRLSSGPSAREMYTSLKRDDQARRDVGQVMLELDQLARQVHGRLDTRFAKLEAVIRDADERIDKLSRLTRAAQGGPALDITLEREDPHQSPPNASGEGDHPHAAVYRLADGGLTPAEIAQEVEKTAGEVELILALRRTKAEANVPQEASATS